MRQFRRFACLLSLSLAAAPAIAQPPKPDAKPIDDVCLSNSCSKPAAVGAARVEYTRNEAAVAAAIKAGKLADLVRAGGTPAEVGAVMRQGCGEEGKRPCATFPAAGTEEFRLFADGTLGVMGMTNPRSLEELERLRQAANGGPAPGITVVLTGHGGELTTVAPPTSVVEREAQMKAVGDAALAARAAAGRPSLMDGAKPNFEPTVIDGRQGARVVSWTLKSGETVTAEEFTRRQQAAANRP